jgi:hypothetical protein
MNKKMLLVLKVEITSVGIIISKSLKRGMKCCDYIILLLHLQLYNLISYYLEYNQSNKFVEGLNINAQ